MRSTHLFQSAKIQSTRASRRAALYSAVRCGMESLESRRLLSAGQLDPTFGKGGIVTDNTLPSASALPLRTKASIYLHHAAQAASDFSALSISRSASSKSAIARALSPASASTCPLLDSDRINPDLRSKLCE